MFYLKIFFLKGQYLYVESSEPRRVGDRAILFSGLLKGLQCMRFRYYMFGQDMGSLSVYRFGDGVMRGRLWRRYGNQGDKWHEARITLPCNATSYMVSSGTSAHNFISQIDSMLLYIVISCVTYTKMLPLYILSFLHVVVYHPIKYGNFVHV